MKKPVIATDVGGDKEMMIDNKTGYLVREGNSEDIIKKLLKLLEDKPLGKEMGENGAKFVNEQFNWKLVTENFLKIIQPYLK